MKNVAATKKVILTGSVIIEENGNYYNRLVWMLPNGQYGYYDKRHLFAYGEEDKHYASGSKRLIASVNGWKVNLMVCYDLRFPVWARQQFDEDRNFEYDVLIYVANWPERRNTAWKSLLRARAIENQCYVIGVNRVGNDGSDIYHSGDSTVIDPLGEILYEKAHDEDIFTIQLNKDQLNSIRKKFQFWRDADDFEILL
jgi:predicted amidohydrolase